MARWNRWYRYSLRWVWLVANDIINNRDVSGTYQVKYRDIEVLVTLKKAVPFKVKDLDTVLTAFYETYRMYIGRRYIGNLLYVVRYLNSIYDRSMPNYLAMECESKITRTVNAVKPHSSRLRGKDLQKVFDEEFYV